MYPPYTPGLQLNTTNVSRVANAGTTEEVLITLWTPPNLLRNLGDCVFIHGSEFLAANTNSKTSKIYFGGTPIAGRTASDSNSLHDMRCFVYRTSPTTVWAVGLTANLATATQIVAQTDITVTLNQPVEIRMAGQGVAAADIASRILRYQYVPAVDDFQF